MCRPAVSVLALPRGPVCRVPVPPAGGLLGRRSFDLPPPVLSRGTSGLLGDRLGAPCSAAPLSGYSSGFGLLSGVEGWSVAPETEQGIPSASTRAPILIQLSERNLLQSVRRGLAADRVDHHLLRGHLAGQTSNQVDTSASVVLSTLRPSYMPRRNIVCTISRPPKKLHQPYRFCHAGASPRLVDQAHRFVQRRIEA